MFVDMHVYDLGVNEGLEVSATPLRYTSYRVVFLVKTISLLIGQGSRPLIPIS
jgi:hypothetical protein